MNFPAAPAVTSEIVYRDAIGFATADEALTVCACKRARMMVRYVALGLGRETAGGRQFAEQMLDRLEQQLAELDWLLSEGE